MRALIIKLHLMIAAFFAPVLLMVALSGGLYLFGQKGQTERTALELPSELTLSELAPTPEEAVSNLLQTIDPDFDFEYLKVSGDLLITRPTSKTYYEINRSRGDLTVTKVDPDWIKALVELHKGHGPTSFKQFQKIMAFGLLFIVLSGLWLGLTAKNLRNNTLLTSFSGLIVFLILAFF
jgi:hypothetical protein